MLGIVIVCCFTQQRLKSVLHRDYALTSIEIVPLYIIYFCMIQVENLYCICMILSDHRFTLFAQQKKDPPTVARVRLSIKVKVGS